MTESKIPSNADNTLMQLGGRNKLKVAIGAKDFFSDDDGNSLVFKIGKGAKNKINHIKISLNATDTYDVTFSAISRKKDKAMGIYLPSSNVVSTHEGIYNDMLKSIVEDETGFYLSPLG
mgnify:CR=1 FL=1